MKITVMNLLNLRNQIAKDLKAQGYDINNEGMFIGTNGKHEGDLTCTSPSGSQFHIVMIDMNEKPVRREIV